MDIQIVGAGMAGLIARSMLVRAGHSVLITERQIGLPNNHSAILRFRTPAVGEITSIPFRKVRVLRCVAPWRNLVADNLAYSRKATGAIAMRSSILVEPGIVDRYIAPQDFIRRLAGDSLSGIAFGLEYHNYENAIYKIPIISTMPMPALAAKLGFKFPDGTEFKSQSGYNLSFEIPGVDVYASVYVPDPKIPWNRISITGNRVIAEYTNIGGDPMNERLAAMTHLEPGERIDQIVGQRIAPMAQQILQVLGLDGTIPIMRLFDDNAYHLRVSEQKYQKIMPIDDRLRKRFMLWASENHNVYSLGRFATWRPGLLLDDLPQDVRRISEMIEGDHYGRRLHASTH